MVPEEASNPAAESPTAPPGGQAAPSGRRPGRGRGHRGRGRRRKPQAQPPEATEPPQPEAPAAQDQAVEPIPQEHLELREGPSPEPAALEEPSETAPSLPPGVEEDLGAPAPATSFAESAPVERPVRAPGPPPRPERPAPPATIQTAIDEVSHVIDNLRESLEQMEEVLEMLEVIERQSGADERELESLRRALRQLQRPREGGPPRRGRP